MALRVTEHRTLEEDPRALTSKPQRNSPVTISQSDAPRGGRAIASRLIEARSFESNHEVLETGPNSDTVDCVQGTMFIDAYSICGSPVTAGSLGDVWR